MKKVNIGVVGAGIYGNYHIRTYSCDPHVETVVFCDLNEECRAATQTAIRSEAMQMSRK